MPINYRFLAHWLFGCLVIDLVFLFSARRLDPIFSAAVVVNLVAAIYCWSHRED
jgi:hypothetical protein